ncbi:hypothetical protein E2C01_048647 [Portunus trituberculatus]|uniref:Uncharacterized protein n=1 Tax=Portunus trituberculatus TaxID=210409 RepID=A0A5B7G703_PORTR|nr:hypothetical protein [Portunus trituberculatus]
MMEGKEFRTTFPEPTLEKDGEEEKVTVMEKDDLETGNEQALGQRDEEKRDFDEERKKESVKVTNNNDSCFLASETVEWESASAEELRSKAVTVKLEEQCEEEDVSMSSVTFIDHHHTHQPEKDEAPHHTATDTQPAANYPPPSWQCAPPSYNSFLQVLRQDVLDMCRWTEGSEAEAQRRRCHVEDVRYAVLRSGPRRILGHGSLANSLCLPDSNVHLVLEMYP